jgi:hypothetical protein
MERSWFSDEQIIAILKEQEPAMPTAKVCRRHESALRHFTIGKPNMGADMILRLLPLRGSVFPLFG